MAWKQGPLPPETYFWGGIVTKEIEGQSGFYFADFHGDHVKIFPSGEVVKAEDVLWYNNSLKLPPKTSKAKITKRMDRV